MSGDNIILKQYSKVGEQVPPREALERFMPKMSVSASKTPLTDALERDYIVGDAVETRHVFAHARRMEEDRARLRAMLKRPHSWHEVEQLLEETK